MWEDGGDNRGFELERVNQQRADLPVSGSECQSVPDQLGRVDEVTMDGWQSDGTMWLGGGLCDGCCDNSDL